MLRLSMQNYNFMLDLDTNEKIHAIEILENQLQFHFNTTAVKVTNNNLFHL